MNDFMQRSIDFITHLSAQYGTGNVVSDVVLLCVLGALCSLLLALIAIRRSSTYTLHPGMERVSSIGGRVEKLEMTLNDFRGEAIRNIELFRGELGYFKQELREIRRLLSGGEGEGGTGGSAPGEGGDFEIPGERKLAPDVQVTAREEVSHPQPDAADTSVEPSPIVTKDEGLARPKGLIAGLAKTRRGLFEKIKSAFSSKPIVDQSLLDELEAVLVSSDLGVKLASSLIASLKSDVERGDEITYEALLDRLKTKVREILRSPAQGISAGIDPIAHPARKPNSPLVILVVGINGVGKTTSVAKLANIFHHAGAKVMLAAADTFRAAAVDQLKEWGERINVPVVAGTENAKPATVVFDAMVRGKAEGADVIIIDTAGRLHTKSNLMQELEGIRNAMARHDDTAPHETVLVVDGATGQNALSQAREFHAAVPLTGLIVTKLDGTPKGGIVVAIKDELGIPIRYIGIGEGKGDLKPFVAEEFAEALFDSSDELLTSSTKLSEHATARRRRREPVSESDEDRLVTG